MNKKEKQMMEFIFDRIEVADMKISKDLIIMGRDMWNAVQLQIKKEL